MNRETPLIWSYVQEVYIKNCFHIATIDEHQNLKLFFTPTSLNSPDSEFMQIKAGMERSQHGAKQQVQRVCAYR